MSVRLVKCRDCGRLFGSEFGQERCAACSRSFEDDFTRILEAVEQGGVETVEHIAVYTGMDEALVQKRAGESSTLSHLVIERRNCRACDDGIAEPGKAYCLRCLSMLHKGLHDATGALRAKIREQGYQPQYPQRSNRVHSRVSEKRGRLRQAVGSPAPQFRKY